MKFFKIVIINISVLLFLVLALELFFITRDKLNDNIITTANDEAYIFYDSIIKINKKVSPNFSPRNYIDNTDLVSFFYRETKRN